MEVVMKAPAIAAFVCLAVPLAPLFGKGSTVKITINGGGLAAAVVITDPGVADFPVWAGPGVHVNGVEQTEGFIIDWPKGVVADVPAGLQRYEVQFYTGCRSDEAGCRDSNPALTYVVSYAYDPSSKEGFVYLPGRSDDAFRYNGAMYHGHGYEGHWLHATAEWEKFARSRIAAARERATAPRTESARAQSR
jgi:hypothetical protein